MSLWAIQSVRKPHSKEILQAKIVDTETLHVETLTEAFIIQAMKLRSLHVENLGIKDNKLVLTGYDKEASKCGTHIYMYRNKINGVIVESFAIALRGYKAVYEFITDNPRKSNGVIHTFGTVGDLDDLLKAAGINWAQYGLYNGIVTNKTWANEDSERYKILKYVEYLDSGDVISTHEYFDDIEMENIANLRGEIECEYCQMKWYNNAPTITHIKFNSEIIELPEGIVGFNKSFGGAHMIVFPKTLNKLGAKGFSLDEDILQMKFKGNIEVIPREFAAQTNLQILEFPDNVNIERIEEYAFAFCEDLNSDLDIQVNEIGKMAFSETAIKNVKITNCKEIGPGAFMNCEKLENLILHNIDTIRVSAFRGCSRLKALDLRNVNKIHSGAFRNCKRLKEVIIGLNTEVSDNAFNNDVKITRM